MNMWESVVLGMIQGLTEFLPVSSSGHLVIAQSFIQGFHQPGILFDVMLHCGTLLAVLFFLRREVYAIAVSLIPQRWLSEPQRQANMSLLSVRRKIVLYIIAGTIVTAFIGLSFEDAVQKLFESVKLVACMLLITGIVLFLADKMQQTDRQENNLTLLDGIIIGAVQGIAIIPGISRSGATIACGLFRRIQGETAARFSFLLSVPAIAGAAVLQVRHINSVSAADMSVYLIGTAVAALTGFLSLKLLFYIVNKRNLRIFAYYCWILGISVLIMK